MEESDYVALLEELATHEVESVRQAAAVEIKKQQARERKHHRK